MQNFEEQLKYGREFEATYARQMMARGWYVIPKYLYAKEGAPALFGKVGRYAVPDLDASRDGRRIWVECKRKDAMRQYPATGYTLKSHLAYKEVQKITGSRVFVVFMDGGKGKQYGNWIDELEKQTFPNPRRQDGKWWFNGEEHILFKYPEAFRRG